MSSSIVIRRRTKLQEADKNIGIFELPYSTIKTLKTIVNSGISDTAFTVRKSFVGTLTSTGDITITANTGETFISQSEADACKEAENPKDRRIVKRIDLC